MAEVTVHLGPLFAALADVFDGDAQIEKEARDALRRAAPSAQARVRAAPLHLPIAAAMAAPDAHPVCGLIAELALPWALPETSADPLYRAHSHPKAHVELLGPDGLVHSDAVRLGLYGINPRSEYGLRTHPAEEVFIMLAGVAWWMRGDAPYLRAGPGARSHHPSLLPHATRTGDEAFLSVYAWRGDIATDDYRYQGLPER